MNDTQVTPRVRWFWVGVAIDPESPERQVIRYACGSASSQLDAARLVDIGATVLLEGSVPVPVSDEFIFAECLEVGVLPQDVERVGVFRMAQAQLSDENPWIVPVKHGKGLLYATGFEPDFEECAKIRVLAGLR